MNGADTHAAALQETTCVEADVLLAAKCGHMDRLCARTHGEPTVGSIRKGRLGKAPAILVGNDTAGDLLVGLLGQGNKGPSLTCVKEAQDGGGRGPECGKDVGDFDHGRLCLVF